MTQVRNGITFDDADAFEIEAWMGPTTSARVMQFVDEIMDLAREKFGADLVLSVGVAHDAARAVARGGDA